MCPSQTVHRRSLAAVIVEAGVEQELAERLHQILQPEDGGEIAGKSCIANALHRFTP